MEHLTLNVLATSLFLQLKSINLINIMSKPTTQTERYFLTFENITEKNLKAFVEYFIDNEAIQEIVQTTVEAFIENENN